MRAGARVGEDGGDTTEGEAMAGDGDRRPEGDGEHQDHRMQRERKRASREEHDAASGPGYTARPTDEEPEDARGEPPDPP